MASSVHPLSPSEDEPEETSLLAWLGKYLPQRTYLYFLLGLPSIYFTRVATVFQEADVTLQEMEKYAVRSASARQFDIHTLKTELPAYQKMTTAWTEFIDTLLREWKTLNLISVLLLS